ncbi:MAG: hypothetical protein K5779_09120 [Saccharofermentans sp.]|nr:hypothetical protein [Saccharofermentans sp.]
MGKKHTMPFSRKELLQVMILLLIFISLFALIHLSNTIFIPTYKRYASCRKLKKQSVEVGDILYLGRPDLNNEWQVIAIENSKALLINKDYVRILSFDAQYNMNSCSHLGTGAGMTFAYIEPGQQGVPADEWNESGIKTWLNEIYLPYEFNESETALMCDCGYGDVFLLSADEYQKYVEGSSDLKIKFPWWLRTSKTYDDETYPDYVQCDDITLNLPIYRGSNLAIRPAMWVETGS